MQAPERGQHHRPSGTAKNGNAECVDQCHVDEVQRKIHRVVPGRSKLVTKHSVVHQIRKSSDRSIETGGRTGVPIFMLENERYVVQRCSANSSVLPDDCRVVEDQSSVERIGVCSEDQCAKCNQAPAMPADLIGMCSWCRRLL